MTLLDWITTNPFGMVWLATTVSLAAVEFAKDGNIHWKLILRYMIISIVTLIFVLLVVIFIDWIISLG